MTQKVRNSNLEFYRIITMLAIVAHHYVVNSAFSLCVASSTILGYRR